MKIAFTVPGRPVGKGRPRFVARGGGRAIALTPENVTLHEQWVRECARRACGEGWAPLDGPIELSAVFYFARPQKHFLRGILRADAPDYHTGAPDLDNLVKCAKDGIGLARLFTNDSRISRYGRIEKRYGEEERTEIEVVEIEIVRRRVQAAVTGSLFENAEVSR